MTDGLEALRRSLTRRRALKMGLAGGALVALTAVGVGCGDDDDASGSGAGEGDLNVVVVSTDLIPGLNRFVFALFDAGGRQVIDVPAQVRLFSGADQPQPKLVAQVEAKPYKISIPETHRHADGTDHVHEELRGIYVAQLEFDSVGIWGFQVATADRRQTPSGAAFSVVAEPSTPAIGAVAPRTESPTYADHKDAQQLCTRVPECGLHGSTIAGAVGRGRPAVVIFSTPAFCVSAVCGPTLDIVLGSQARHRNDVDYVHVEIYKDGQTRQLLDSVREWNLPTEPWTFIVDGDGKLAAKFEAIVAPEELEAALKPLLSA